MLDYEYLFSTALHTKLKEGFSLKLIGTIFWLLRSKDRMEIILNIVLRTLAKKSLMDSPQITQRMRWKVNTEDLC